MENENIDVLETNTEEIENDEFVEAVGDDEVVYTEVEEEVE